MIKNLYHLGPFFALFLFVSCLPKDFNVSKNFNYLPPENNIKISLISPPPVPSPESRGPAASGPSPEVPGNKASEISFSPLPQDQMKVWLTLTESHSGAVKKVAHMAGSGNLDLSGLPDGTYSLLVETSSSSGLRPPSPQTVEVKDGKFKSIELKFERIETDNFYYYWESDHEGREFEYSANENVSPHIEFLDEIIEVPQTSASQLLRDRYNIILRNTEDHQWTYQLASTLLKAVSGLPHNKLRKSAQFILTQKEVANDIKFVQREGHYVSTISLKAFAYASDKMVKLNGKRGKFFSRRLFQAMVYFFTNRGEDHRAIRKILGDKFNVTTRVNNYMALTGENGHNFQSFHSDELLHIISAFSEMPEGFYRIPGLRYLVRRKDGHPHPLYPEAPAVAWPRGSESDSYIEFMDTAFIGRSKDYMHRLILHEKSHFLWRNVFTLELQDTWIKLGNWFRNSESVSGWSTTDTSAFVSSYAHAKNPNEDMAESISYYVLNPKKLLSVASKKFDFIEKRIMNGYRYVSSIRKDLTFEVLNLYPDYDYPGKIRRVEVSAFGDRNENKNVVITIELTDKKGMQDSAQHASTRVFSPNDTFKDLYLYPVGGNRHLLRGSLIIPKKAKNGYWKVSNITVTDEVGNKRMEGIIDFGFKLYINNQIEDTTPPQYVPNTIGINVQEEIVSNGKQIFNVNVSWKIKEDNEMRKRSPVFANLISLDYNDLYRIQGYGPFNRGTKKGHVRLVLTEYHPPGDYGITYINMQDMALNRGRQYFSSNPAHRPVRFITITSRNPDYKKPVLDPNRMAVQAVPLNPSAPDGRTRVNIIFYAKDNKSGLGYVNYKLMDPLGKVHYNYFYHSNFYTRFFKGNPTVYKKYEIKTTLPKGSAPGQWGVMEIVLHDKAGNINTYNFLETIHFQLE